MKNLFAENKEQKVRVNRLVITTTIITITITLSWTGRQKRVRTKWPLVLQNAKAQVEKLKRYKKDWARLGRRRRTRAWVRCCCANEEASRATRARRRSPPLLPNPWVRRRRRAILRLLRSSPSDPTVWRKRNRRRGRESTCEIL